MHLVLLALVGSAGAQPLLAAVVPDLPGPGPGDEGFALRCATPCDLHGLQVTDGEGTWSLPAVTLAAGQTAWFVGDPAIWNAHDGPAFHGVFDGPTLANDGDQLHLTDAAGHVLDAFAWGHKTSPNIEGAITYRSPGLIYTRGPGPDTDHADDWRTPRTHRIGESTIAPADFIAQRAILYSSPDSSHETLASLIAEAASRLHLHVYALRSASLVDAMVDARAGQADLDLQVLVTRTPVGFGSDDRHETAWALQRIKDAGGQAWLAGTGRYDVHHLKVLVADDWVAVQSENWVPSGVPEDPTWGNRGWGIALQDPALADWFASWMEADRQAWDTAPFEMESFDPGFEPPARFHPRSGPYPPASSLELEGPIRVTPLVAPEHTADPRTDPVRLAIAAASDRVWAQQLDLRLTATNRLGFEAPDPLVEALESAARRGLDVRVQAASPFSSDDEGNRGALQHLEAAGASYAAELVRPGLGTLHNKGLVIDDAVVVGSMNGNHHSRSENREVSVMVHDVRAAQWYGELFLSDTAEARSFQDRLTPGPYPLLLGVLLLGAVRWHLRR